jgi:hypothetical protein
MLVKIAKCPHCGGKFDPGSEFCIYCGFGLIYGDNKEGVKEKLVEKITSLVKEGRLVHLAHEREYYGCPICLKVNVKKFPRCNHTEEPVKLFWRKYVARDSSYEKFVVECTPKVGKLEPKKLYRFYGTFYSEDDRFIINNVIELENWGEQNGRYNNN